jgi:nucleotide-binding universal stress UspA family protein
MLKLANILLPVDFSDGSVGAGKLAGILACRFESKVTILHVVPTEYPIVSAEMGVASSYLPGERLSEAQGRMKSYMAEELVGTRFARVVVEGDPAIKIVEWAHTANTDLIVMPTHGYGVFRRFLLGSVTAKVLHDVNCPVLTGVHLAEAPPREGVLFRTILCAIDLEQRSEVVLTYAAHLATALEAQLHVVHALPPPESGQSACFDPDLRLDLGRRAKEQIAELQEKAGTQADVIIHSGKVTEIIAEAAQSTKADVVVIGRHAHSGAFRRLLAHAYAVIRESPCPVVSV